ATLKYLNLPEDPWLAHFRAHIPTWQTYHDYETNDLSCDEFFLQLKEWVGHPAHPDEYTIAWNILITGAIEGIEPALDNIKKKVPLYALSNTSRAHYDYFMGQFPLFEKFDRIFTSFELGVRK